MAEARLIPKYIYHSMKFLQMSATAQNLLTFLILNTDNDGIVEAYSIMSMIHASMGDLKSLSDNGFVSVLDENWVTYINEFQKFNKFDKRNFRISKHRDLLVKVHPELEKDLIIPQKRTRNNNPMGFHGEENRIEEKRTKDIIMRQNYNIKEIEKDILAN